MSNDQNTEFTQFEHTDDRKEALKQASQELADDGLQSFALITYDGDQSKVTMHADQMHQETEMPMPQMLLATLIYNLSQRSGTQPLRIGQAATYAAEQVFYDATDQDFVRDFSNDLGDL